MGLVSGLLIASAALSAGGQISAGRGMRRAANDTINEGNRLAEDAVARGEDEVRRYSLDLASLMGTQRARIAAGGVDVTTGTAGAVRDQTVRFGAEDVDTIRENVMREAYGLRQSAQNRATQLRAGATAQFAGAFGTALSFGANAWELHQRSRGGSRVPANVPATLGAGGLADWG